jgi:hypothetical protein
MSGLIYLAPCSYPPWNFLINGISIPPTKPTVPLSDFMAAIIPTKNEPSCSLKTIC